MNKGPIKKFIFAIFGKMDLIDNLPDPIAIFIAEQRRAKEAGEHWEACAGALATVNETGAPTVRFVLVKGADERGLRFFTNRESEKGKHLARDRRAAIAFHFTTTGVQLRFEGEAFPLNDEESDIYFRERPRESQIGAWASKQSQILESWEALIQQYHEFSRHFEGKEVGRPPQWGGYRLEVKRAEYWLEGMYRLHKRVRFERTPDGWVKNWLYP